MHCHVCGSVSAERVGQGEVSRVTCRVTCTPVAARLGCHSTMVGTGWANSCPGCMDRLRKCYTHVAGGSFLAGKAAWALSECVPTKSG